MYVPEIIEVKEQLNILTSEKLIQEWELPYENILTRRSAALFFVAPVEGVNPDSVWKRLERFEHFSVRLNHEKKLSALPFRISFNKEEKEKNELIPQEVVSE